MSHEFPDPRSGVDPNPKRLVHVEVHQAALDEVARLTARVATMEGAAQTAASLLTSMFYAPPEMQPRHYAMLARDALLAALAPAPASKGDE